MLTNRNGNILVITYWPASDPLIQAYTLPYLKIIRELNIHRKIYLLTLDKNKERKEELEAQFRNLQIHWLSYKYHSFGPRAILKATYMLISLFLLVRFRQIKVVHGWCTPAGGLAYILAKITGCELVIDSFEPHADPMYEAGIWGRDSLAFRILTILEKLQSSKAKYAIGCVESMQDYTLSRYGVKPLSFDWKPASVDFNNFSLDYRKDPVLTEELQLQGKVVMLYVGKFGGSYLESEVFDIFKVANDFYRDRLVVLILNNQPADYIQSMAKSADLDPAIVIHRYVDHLEIAKFIGLGDIGLIPFKPVPSKRYGSPIKTGEYMALGIPMIITEGISDDSELVESQNLGYVLKDLNKGEYINAIRKVDGLLKEKGIHDRIYQQARIHKNWKRATSIYQRLYG